MAGTTEWSSEIDRISKLKPMENTVHPSADCASGKHDHLTLKYRIEEAEKYTNQLRRELVMNRGEIVFETKHGCKKPIEEPGYRKFQFVDAAYETPMTIRLQAGRYYIGDIGFLHLDLDYLHKFYKELCISEWEHYPVHTGDIRGRTLVYVSAFEGSMFDEEQREYQIATGSLAIVQMFLSDNYESTGKPRAHVYTFEKDVLVQVEIHLDERFTKDSVVIKVSDGKLSKVISQLF